MGEPLIPAPPTRAERDMLRMLAAPLLLAAAEERADRLFHALVQETQWHAPECSCFLCRVIHEDDERIEARKKSGPA